MRTQDSLRILRKATSVGVLGPYQRAVIWVQGCPFRCPGCITPEGLSFEGGEQVPVADLAAWVLSQKGIEGVTFSGGEPFAQAEALLELVEAVRKKRELGVMSYTGHTHNAIRLKGTDLQREFLGVIDLLIDGKYVREKHADLLWRGSTNQKLVFLTERYKAEAARIIAENGDKNAGLEIHTNGGNDVLVVGVPYDKEIGARIRGRLEHIA